MLSPHIQNALLVRSESLDAALEQLVSERLDVLVGLKPRLLQDVQKLPRARILDDQFSAVQQAIGTLRSHEVGAAFLRDFVEEAKASGLVADLIERSAPHPVSSAANNNTPRTFVLQVSGPTGRQRCIQTDRREIA